MGGFAFDAVCYILHHTPKPYTLYPNTLTLTLTLS